MLKELLPAIIGACVRWVITVLSTAGVVVGPSTEAQATSGLIAIGMLVWSAWQKRKAIMEKLRAMNGSSMSLLLALALSLSLTLGLSACAGQSPNDCLSKVAATEVAITHGYQTTAQLLAAGTISKAVASKALTALDTANAAVDNAAPMCKMHDPQVTDYLTAAAAALAQFATLTGGK